MDRPFTFDDTNLSANIARLNGGNQVFSGAVSFSSAANNFTGNDAGLTGLNAWALSGNAGANPAVGNFLGTTDNLPLELRVNGSRAVRLEPNTSGAPNVILGSAANWVANGVVGATIAGGGAVDLGGVLLSNRGQTWRDTLGRLKIGVFG